MPGSRLLFALALWLAACGAMAQSASATLSDVRRLHYAGQSDAALHELDGYLADHPKDAEMRFAKGVILAELHRTDAAMQVFREISVDHPDLAEPYNNLAALYAERGDYEQARTTLEQALRANPGYATAQENLGDVYLALARQAYLRAQRIDPRNATLTPKLAQLRELIKLPAVPTAASAAAAH